MASSAATSSAGSAARRAVLTFVTGNKKKLEEFVALVPKGFAFDVTNHKIDLPELQGEPEEISAEKCRLAAKEVGGPVMVEDTSLCYNALGGMPGPYIKWFLDKLGHEGLNKILAGYDDKTAYAQCIFAFTPHPSIEPTVFVGRCPGKIVPARGPKDFGWDPVFQPDGYDTTFAEMDKAEKNKISHRSVAMGKLMAYLEKNQEDILKTLKE